MRGLGRKQKRNNRRLLTPACVNRDCSCVASQPVVGAGVMGPLLARKSKLFETLRQLQPVGATAACFVYAVGDEDPARQSLMMIGNRSSRLSEKSGCTSFRIP